MKRLIISKISAPLVLISFFIFMVTVSSVVIAAFSGKWDQVSTAPQGTRYHAVTVWKEYLYQIGGETDWWIPITDVLRFSTIDKTWDVMSPLPAAVCGIDAVTIGDLIYVPGGSDDTEDWTDGGTFLDTLHIYHAPTNTWFTGSSMPVPLACASAVTHEGKLYVVGGLMDSGTASQSLYIYDPSLNSWSMGAAMSTVRCLASAGVIDGKIYVAGGYTGGNYTDTTLLSMEIYDIAGNSWSAGPDLPSTDAGWAPYGDGVLKSRYLIAFNGGDLADSTFSCTQHAVCFDTLTNTWKELPDLNRCLYGSQGATAGNSFYLVSGRTNEGGWHMATEVEQLVLTPPPSINMLLLLGN